MSSSRRDNVYRSLKVHINTLRHNRELEIYQHLNSPTLKQSNHGGKEHLRELYDYFRVDGPHGTHDVLVLRPLGASIRDIQKIFPDCVFDYQSVPDMLLQILPTIHFLHTEAGITHSGSSIGIRLLTFVSLFFDAFEIKRRHGNETKR